MEKATIFDIQRNSFVDGPGIRTTVFLRVVTLNADGVTTPKVNHRILK